MLNLGASGRGLMILGLALVLGGGRARAGGEESISAGSTDGWNFLAESHGVRLYSRPREGSRVKEFRAVGKIAASTAEVHGVLSDVEAYPGFMPYTAECRLLRQSAEESVEYQRLDPPLCRPRDYTLLIHLTTIETPRGMVYHHQWEPANGEGPAEKPGVVRVKVCEGGWLLEPLGPKTTRATYTIFTDSGGALPAFLANRASQMAIPRIFEAIRKQVKNPKYARQAVVKRDS